MKRTHTRFPRKFISGLSLVLLISTFCGVLGHVWMTSAAGRRFATLVSQTIKSPFFGQQHSSGASKEVADTSYPTSPAILNVNPMTIERAAVSSAAPSFGTATNFGVGTSPVGVAVGDFNLDGQPDLAVANNSSSNVSVLLGNGAGSFGAATNFGAGTTCVGVAVGDFNLDGKPDLAVTNANFTGGTVSVLLGNGAGSFGAATSFAVGDAPRSVTVGDFNLDGKPDLAVANTNSNTVSVLLGNGAGSFGAATSFAVGNAPRSVAMGDFNLDGKADLVTANNSSSNLSVLLGNGAGSFGAATNFGVGTSPAWVTVGDFNLDGKPDLATANNAASSVSVLMGDGAGVFGAAASFSVGGGPQSVAVGDFNLDGKPDLAAPNFGSGTVSVLPGNGAGSFGTATIFGVGSVPPGVAVGDFNLDGKPDLAVTNQGSGNVSVLLNQTDQVPCTGTAFGTVANFGASSNPQSVAVGDFNLDGKPDLAVANNNISNIVSVLLGNGAGSFGAVATFGAGSQPCSVAVADFNLDGKPDLATANLASANVSVLLGNGAGSFGAAANFGAGTQPFAVAVGDFNLDGKPDLAVANNSSSNVSVLLGNGAGSFGAATNFGVSTNPRSVAVGDFNLDGKPDLAVANFFTNNVSVLLGNGAGSFGAATNFTVGTRPQSVAVGDFNQDGKPDLATANTSSANVSVLLGNGAGSFGAATNFTAATIPNSVAVGDFNRDGKADLAVANGGSNNVSVLLGNGAGSFGTASNFGVGTNPQVVTVGDFNLDGKPDLAAANNGSANTSVLLNTCSTCPTITGTVSGTTAICPAGSATVTVTVTGGAPPYTVTLTNGGGTQTGNSPLTFTVAPGATTTYTVQSGTDANSCTITGSGSATVTVDSLPGTPTIIPTSASVCPSSSGNQASGPAGATSYAWTITNGTITSATNLQTITYTAGASGTVGLMLTVTNATGCAASNSANVTINTSGIFAVTNGNDSGAGSLRDTIANACPGSTITFSGVSTVTLTTAELLISKNITIDGGSGVTVTRSTAGGTPDFRIFNIASGSTVMLSGLTISNGKSNSEDLGGGIFNDGGTLTVNGCRIDSNIALDAQGGGVANNSGTVIINNSTISNNSAGLGGGGLSNLGLTGTATMTLTNCTISGNTVTDTMVTDTAGGVENGTSDQAANLTVLNCTIANNSTLNSINAGGLLSFVFGAGTTDIKIKNTIIAGNSDSQVLDEGSSFTSQGNNLIADNGDGVFTGAGDLLNTNPLLAALSNYGGTTMTHALLPGSPAINAGTSSGAPTNDQRGKSRFGNVDIGAFESQGFTLAATGGGGQSTTVNTNFANPLTLTIAANNAADNEPVNGGNITFTAPGSGASCSFASNPATISGGAASSGTVTANGTAGSYNVTANASGAASSVSYALTNIPANTAPSFVTVATPSRQQGSPVSNSTIATVTDAETAASSLTVTVTTTNPSNGVTVSNIQNTNGTITADIVASCTASNASFTLQVSDGSLTNTATLSISVTANTAPTVGTYAATAVALNGTMTVTPNAAPADNGTIASVTATASPNTFTGTFSGDTSTGAVTITNAAPAGVYTITVTVTDNCGATVVKTFALMVDMCTPAPSNLGLWYRAEGNANAFVGGVNASTATNSGQASPTSPTYTTGKVGQAWSFNGTTDALDSGATTILNTFPVTIEAWVNPALRNDAGTTNLSGMVYPNNTISNDKAGFYGHGFGVNVTPDGSQFTIEYNDGFRVVPQANASFSAGQWYHIVVVYGLTGNQGSFKAYVNGQLVDQLTYTQGIVDGLSLIRIGYHNDDNGYGTRRFFKGLLDEVSIYQGCALQLADIQALYQAGAAGKCLSPLNLNTPPTITAAGTLSRSRGSSSVSTIATVNDTETPAGNLTVAVQSAPTGITVSNIQNSNGTITATVAADCTATLGNNTVVLYVSDGACATPFANLIVNVTANTSPTLMYNSASVTVGGSTMITPMAGPSDNGSIASIVVQGVGAFTGTISVNSMTGAISVSSAAPVGMHTITIRATDNCLATTDTTFVLSVTCPTITLNPTSLAAGTVGTGYSQSVTASPAGTYSYGVTSGALPNGLTLNTSDGTISGTPTAAGTFNFRITAVLTGTGCSDFRDYSVVISCPTITLGALTGGTVGTSYNQSVAASPAGTYSYSVTSGLMPNGLSLNTSDGTVSGTPTAAGTFNFRITAVLTGTGCFNFRDYSVVISCPTITLGALTGGTVGTIYNQSVAASPAGTYSYSVTSGLVPNGLTLNTSDGTVSGTPTAAGTFNFRITAVLTGTGCSNFRDYSVVIVCPTITLGSLSGVGTVGANYNQSAAASPAGTYSYGITSGALPNGLTLNLSNGTVSGTPTAAGTFNFRITATLTGSTCTGFSDYSIVVTCPTVTLNPTTLPGGSLGVGYNQSVTASPAGTYSYGVTSGSLPNGLTLNLSNGAITGIPTVAGVFNFRIAATMSGCTGFGDYSIVICPLMSSCPTNITTNAANGQCSAVVNYTPPTANAGCAGTTVACVPNSGSSFTVGTTTVTCTATDAFNNTASCSFTVQVNDNQSPVLGTCPANITNFPAANGSCAATVTFTPPTVNDNCAGAIVTCTPASGSSFALGTTTVTCSAKDAANNMSAACTFTVQVVDTTPPTLGACPANITGQSAGANCTAVVTYTNPTASDNCGTPTVTCTPASGSSFALGTTTVSCVAKDAANNMSAACTFTVQVLDTTPPTLGACPANITNQAAGANCTAAVTFTPPTATDNCGTPTVTCTPASGSSFALGTTTVSCVAKDAANNMSAACTFTVQVTDTTPPTLGACPANITNQSAGAACTAVVTYTNPTASDNCGTPTVTCSPASGSSFALGTTTVSCVAKDAANNMSAACTFTVQVVDTTPPTLGACPANITNVAAASGQCSAVVNFTRPTASDNCGTPTVTCAPASGSSFVVGTTTVSCVAKDSANNMSAACTFTVQVVDTQNPTISCPSNQNVGTSGSSAVVTYPAPTASDNCISVTTNCVPPSGSTFGLGTTTVTCTATDASLRTASCSFTVLVTNTCAGIVCPSNVFVGTTGNSTVVNYPAPSANGTCGAIICSPASGSVFNVGVTTVTCNSSIGNQSCSFNVTVNRVSGTASDPLICTGPGNTVQATLVITNNGNANQTVADTTSFTNLVGVPGTCTVTPNVGTCVVTNGGLTYNASLTPGQTVTITYLTQVGDLVQTGQQVCTNNSVTFNGGAPYLFSACGTANCPTQGPGNPFPAAAEGSDQKAGSVLIYNVFTSGATSGNTQNTRINITNTHGKLPAFVHLFFVAEGCSIADSYLCLTANQTASFLASDLDPGTTGYLVAVAVNALGCPTNFNSLIGDEYVKFTSGHAANLAAEAFAALPGGLPLCDGNSVTATLNFDGVSYNRLPAVLAMDSVGSRADGNDTLLILNRIGGNLGIGASTLGTLFGVIYDDAENALSFNVAGSCQLRNSISNNFPRTTPRFESFIPAGRTGWLKLFSQTGTVGITGAAINFNANAASSAGAFNQGHNLHHLTLNNQMSYIIPVFPPSC